MEVAALGFVGVDVLIDALMGKTGEVVLFEIASNLFGRPLLAQQGFDLVPGFACDAGSILFGLAALLGFVVGLFRAIATLTAIAPEFAGNSRFINVEFPGNSGLRKTGFAKSINLVSLVLSKLCVGCHPCSFDSATREA